MVYIGDTVIDRHGQVGIVDRVHDTGQVLVHLKKGDALSNVWCTYDSEDMLTKVVINNA